MLYNITILLIKLVACTFIVFSIHSQEIEKQDRQPKEEILTFEPKKINADLSLIIPPSGFEISELFNGYIYPQGSASIIMTLVEGVNYIKVCEGMNESFFKQNKLTLISDEKFISNNKIKGHIYKFLFKINEVDFIREMVFAGDLTKTLWLNITYPKRLNEIMEDEMLKSIMSITLNPLKNEDK
jgi:hypothetical protein